MITSVFRFPLDVNQSQSQASIVAGVHEDGIRLIMRLVENGAPFDIHHAARAEFSAVLPGGEPVMNPCMIFGQGTVVYDFTGAEVQEAGVVTCQLFLYNPDGSLILSSKFTLVVHENAAAGGEEVAAQKEYETLKKFVREISNVQNVLGTLHEEIYGDLDPNCKYDKDFPYDPDYKINNYRSRIDLLEEAIPITGSITILSADWRVTEAEGFHYEVFAELPNAPISGSDVVLLAPETDKTRVDSTDMSVTVSSAVSNGVLTDGLRFYSRIVPTAPLHYRYVIIKQGKDDDGTSQAIAAIVGITDVPQYVRDRLTALRERLDEIDSALEEHRADIDGNAASIVGLSAEVSALAAVVNDPGHGLSAVEGKIDNFLYGVTDEARDQLSEVLSLISANEQAIQQFVSMGGAPVGSGTLVVPASEWSDGTPTGAMIGLPANTMGAGSVMLLTPSNDATKEAASKARLTVSVDISGDSGGNTKDYVVLLRAETAAKPAIDMEFAYVILQTTAATSLVTLIGVDAAGGTEPTEVDLSAFDPDENGKGYITEVFGEGEDAPKKIIEVVYDDAGNIIKIGNTAINWGEEG